MPTFPGKFQPGQMPEADGNGGWRPGKIITPWRDYGPIIVGAVTTAPAKGSPITRDNTWMRRVGDSAEIVWDFRQTNNSGVPGSGIYLFQLPGGIVADASKCGAIDTINQRGTVGIANVFSEGVAMGAGYLSLYSPTQVWALAGQSSGAGLGQIGSGWYSLNTSNIGYYFRATIPIVGWN